MKPMHRLPRSTAEKCVQINSTREGQVPARVRKPSSSLEGTSCVVIMSSFAKLTFQAKYAEILARWSIKLAVRELVF